MGDAMRSHVSICLAFASIFQILVAGEAPAGVVIAVGDEGGGPTGGASGASPVIAEAARAPPTVRRESRATEPHVRLEAAIGVSSFGGDAEFPEPVRHNASAELSHAPSINKVAVHMRRISSEHATGGVDVIPNASRQDHINQQAELPIMEVNAEGVSSQLRDEQIGVQRGQGLAGQNTSLQSLGSDQFRHGGTRVIVEVLPTGRALASYPPSLIHSRKKSDVATLPPEGRALPTDLPAHVGTQSTRLHFQPDPAAHGTADSIVRSGGSKAVTAPPNPIVAGPAMSRVHIAVTGPPTEANVPASLPSTAASPTITASSQIPVDPSGDNHPKSMSLASFVLFFFVGAFTCCCISGLSWLVAFMYHRRSRLQTDTRNLGAGLPILSSEGEGSPRVSNSGLRPSVTIARAPIFDGRRRSSTPTSPTSRSQNITPPRGRLLRTQRAVRSAADPAMLRVVTSATGGPAMSAPNVVEHEF